MTTASEIKDLQRRVMTLETSGSGAGAPGLSAYQVAVNNGFVGTEAEYVAATLNPPGVARIQEFTIGDGINRVLLVNHGMGVIDPTVEFRLATITSGSPIVWAKIDYAPIDINSGNVVFNSLNPVPAAGSISVRFTASS